MLSPYLDSNPMTPGAVGLVITRTPVAANVMTVSFFSEVAHYPASCWVSIHRDSFTHRLIDESGMFSLAMLHSGQKDLALFCGSVSGRDQDKCSKVKLHPGPEGYLFPDEALTAVACRVRSARDLGEYTLYIADLLSGELDTKRKIHRHLLTSELL